MLGFLGIGAQKAGTTWLYEQLRRHPAVAFRCGKEQHFWDRPYFPDDVAGYLQRFSARDRVEGDITPAYSILARTTIADIYCALPDAKLVLILRDPRDRAWSAALMALGRADMTISEASDQWFIDHFRSRGSLARGSYAEIIHNWQSVYPAEALLVLFFEDLVAHPRGVLSSVAQHLGIDANFHLQWSDDALRRPVFAGSGEPIRNSLQPVLHELYRRRIMALEEILGRSIHEWSGRYA